MRAQVIKLNGVIAAVLTAAAHITSFTGALLVATPVRAADKKITMATCRSLALAASSAYEDAEMAVESKAAAYESAVKSLRLKEKSMSTFRWSPLLSFKFPTKPNLAEGSEFAFKPVQLTYEIQEAQHKMRDMVFDINEAVNNLYVEIVVLQQTIAFNEKRAEAYQTGLDRNRAKLKVGEASKNDVDSLEKKLDTVKKKIASDRRTLEADLKKLSTKTGIDLTTGYSFERPFVEATISRDQLQALIQYTEDRDETYYEACMNEVTKRGELTTNFGLLRNQVGGDINIISGYVTQALNGNSIRKKAFKADYKTFLTQIDSYWEGHIWIIFFKIPKLWFKGDIDGTRYVDDDPYVLFQNVLDYSSALNEKKTAKQELDQSVEDSFNNYISVRNSYQQYVKDADKAEAELNASQILNRLGQLSYEEYDAQLSSYEELQNSMLDAMKLYTTTLYSFDRQTCGGVSALLSGTDADMQTAQAGESYPEKQTEDGAYYYMKKIIQQQEFELTLYIPEDFETPITDFELWVDNVQLGGRVAVKGGKIRHLALTKDKIDEAKIRLYNGDDFVDDCVIDPEVESGPIRITSGYQIKKNESDILGTYEIAMLDSIGMIELKVVPEDPAVKKYRVLNKEGVQVGGSEPLEIKKSIRYLPLLTSSLADLTVELCGEDGGVKYTARLDEANGKLRKAVNEE